jgi:hypothetical protein
MISFGPKKTPKADEREAIRRKFWPNERAWITSRRKGYFNAPRSLPLVFELLKSKKINTKRVDLSLTYLALWARLLGEGVVEITNEHEVAYDAGYSGERQRRTWRERMALLEELGFIKSKQIAGQPYRYVLMIDPAVAVAKFERDGLVDPEWLDTYQMRRLTTKELVEKETKKKASAPAKVVPIKAAKDTK